MISEEVLREAAKEANQIMLASLPDIKECKHIFSHRLKRKMKLVEKKANQPTIYRISKQVASFILILLFGSVSVLTLNAEVRSKIVDWISLKYETVSTYYFSKPEKHVSTTSNFELGFVPEGYHETHTINQEGAKGILYENENGMYLKLLYLDATTNSRLYISTQNSTHSTAYVDEYPADLYVFDNISDGNTLVWIDEKYNILFTLSGCFEPETLIQMAESIIISK